MTQPACLIANTQLRRTFEADEFVTVYLNDSMEEFQVKKALLCSASRFFAEKFQGKTLYNAVRLSGCIDAQLFKLFFLPWLNRQGLPDVNALIGTRPKEQQKSAPNLLQSMLVRLWVFGDIYLMRGLQNAAMQHLVNLLHEVPVTPAAIQAGFAGTADGSLLRRVLVKEAVKLWEKEELDVETADALGVIPGFFHAFVSEIDACANPGCVHPVSCWSTYETGAELFMLPEDS